MNLLFKPLNQKIHQFNNFNHFPTPYTDCQKKLHQGKICNITISLTLYKPITPFNKPQPAHIHTHMHWKTVYISKIDKNL